jgi:hypothetical protein
VVVACWWLLPRRPGLAGVVLALAFVKPALALLPALCLLGWSVAHGRRRAVLGFVIASVMLVGGSLALLPGWPGEFIRSTRDYALGAAPRSAGTALGPRLAEFAGAGASETALSMAICLAVLVAVGWAWWRSARTTGDALAAGVLAGAWVVPPLYEWNNVLLLAVWLAAARRAADGSWRAVVLFMGVQVVLGALTVMAYTRDSDLARIIWPALTLGVYVVWGVRSPHASPASTPTARGPQSLQRVVEG